MILENPDDGGMSLKGGGSRVVGAAVQGGGYYALKKNKLVQLQV